MEKAVSREKQRKKMKDLSLRTTFVIYVAVTAVIATFICSLAINAADSVRMQIYYRYRDNATVYEIPDGGYYDVSYGDTEAVYTIYGPEGSAVTTFIFKYGSQTPMPEYGKFNGSGWEYVRDSDASQLLLVFPEYSDRDRAVMSILTVIGGMAIPVCYLAAIILCAMLFYRKKLRRPIAILDAASAKIAENELDFSIRYDSRDEMGRLCNSFEKMRAALDENNRELWRQVEERRRLNAAFSHDLRTPLTVLKGHADMLCSAAAAGELSAETAAGQVRSMQSHIVRLENYVEAMARLQRLEDVQVNRSPTECIGFLQSLRDSAEILAGDKTLLFEISGDETVINIDSEIVMQVYENLLSNALRYAKSTIKVSVSLQKSMLTILVEDDGPGFSPVDLKKAAAPFYKSKSGSSDGHLGLGLNICDILCHRHGGALSLSNSPAGALVSVSFGTIG